MYTAVDDKYKEQKCRKVIDASRIVDLDPLKFSSEV